EYAERLPMHEHQDGHHQQRGPDNDQTNPRPHPPPGTRRHATDCGMKSYRTGTDAAIHPNGTAIRSSAGFESLAAYPYQPGHTEAIWPYMSDMGASAHAGADHDRF